MKAMRVATLLIVVLCVSAAWAQESASKPEGTSTAKPAAKPQAPTVGSLLNGAFSSVEKEFVDAADAMPEEKYGFAPTEGEFKGVRTFAQQVRHVAAVNYILAAAILGKKPTVDTGGESGPESLTSKADIMKYLRDSFAVAHESMVKITAQNQTESLPSPFGPGKMPVLVMATIAISHPFDHYGQMVEYLRMNNIIPPASRPQPAK